MNNNIKYISVSALNRYISYKFDMDENLKEVYLKGEISNFKYSGKHCYFSVKDENSEISAMFFYPDNLTLKFVPKDGMSVQLKGNIQVYLVTHNTIGRYAYIREKSMFPISLGCRSNLVTRDLHRLSYRKAGKSYQNIVLVILHTAHTDASNFVTTWRRTGI